MNPGIVKDEMSREKWSRKAWDSCASSGAYNSGWWETLTVEKERGLWTDLHSIFEEEKALPEIPRWASDIIGRMMELPMCGYYAYPANVMQILNAIHDEQCPAIVLRCYTADSHRKMLLSYYVYCLDGWLKNAPIAEVIAELSFRDQIGKNWREIASVVYRTLGEPSEIKKIVVERLIHRQRWWIKSLIWMDDKRDRFLLDVYSGAIMGDEEEWGAYGNSPYGDPFFVELRLPYVKAMEEQILAEVTGAAGLLERIHCTWLCAPKAFRYLERLISEIGAIGSGPPPAEVPSFLHCEDTYPDFAANRAHFEDLLRRLRLWLDGDERQFGSLDAASPVKRWLVHILWHKLKFHAEYEENFGKFMGLRPHGKNGAKSLTDDVL